MVSIIKNQLLKHLSRFTKNLSADKINLSTFKGEGELTNLELDEQVLTELLELPAWIRLKSGWCNRVSFRIPWTKLKSVPMCLTLDEVKITVETCDTIRVGPESNTLSGLTGPQGKYSFIHKVIDGMTIIVNTVIVTFKSPAFEASVQICRIRVESRSPDWSAADLRMTRLKHPDLDTLLIFKQLQWQTVRIEARSTLDEDLTPLRLLTNQASCRITIKKRVSDCMILGSRLCIILDELLWVLTDSQLKAALHFADSLTELIQEATEATRKTKAARKLELLPEYQQVSKPKTTNDTSSSGNSSSSNTPMALLFARYDVVETSYHFLSRGIDLHLCDDPGDGRSSHPRLRDGAALQISLSKFQVDYYPYHLARGNRKHWPKYREASIPPAQWLQQSLSAFTSSVLDLVDPSKNHTPLGRTNNQNQNNTVGGSPLLSESNISSPPRSPKDNLYKDDSSGLKGQMMSQLSKLMSSCLILRIQDLTLYKTTTSKKTAHQEFISDDKDRYSLPEDYPTLHAEFTYYYYPKDEGYPLPPPKLFAHMNPIQMTLDTDTCLWLNAFALNLHQSLTSASLMCQTTKSGIDSASGGPTHAGAMYIDVKLEAIMTRIIFESTKEFTNQKDRPASLHIQISRLCASNVRERDGSSRADLESCLDRLQNGGLVFSEDFPTVRNDFNIVHQKFLSHVHGQDAVRPQPPKLYQLPLAEAKSRLSQKMLWTESRDVFCLKLDPIWADFFGAKSVGKARPVPLLDALPVTMWLYKNPEAQGSKQTETGSSGYIPGLDRKDDQRKRHNPFDTENEILTISQYELSKSMTTKPDNINSFTVHQPINADINALVSINNLVSVQINHYQYLFLMRLLEEVAELTTFLSLDSTRILKQDDSSSSLLMAAIIPQVEVTLVMACMNTSKEFSGDVESMIHDSASIAEDLHMAASGMTNNSSVCSTMKKSTPAEPTQSPLYTPESEPANLNNIQASVDIIDHCALSSQQTILTGKSTVDRIAHSVTPPKLSSDINFPSISKDINAGFSTMKRGLTSLMNRMDSTKQRDFNIDDMTSDTMSIRSDLSDDDSENFIMVAALRNVDPESQDNGHHCLDAMFSVNPFSQPGDADVVKTSPIEVANEVLVFDEPARTSASTPTEQSHDSCKRKDLISMSTFKLTNIEFVQQSCGFNSNTKVQFYELNCEECSCIPWDELQRDKSKNKFASRSRVWSSNTASSNQTATANATNNGQSSLPSSADTMMRSDPKVRLRLDHFPKGLVDCESALTVQRYSDAMNWFDDKLDVKVDNLEVSLNMSTVSGLIDFIEDEVVAKPMPMEITLNNVGMTLCEDRQSHTLIQSGGSGSCQQPQQHPPVRFCVEQMYMTRDHTGEFRIPKQERDAHDDGSFDKRFEFESKKQDEIQRQEEKVAAARQTLKLTNLVSHLESNIEILSKKISDQNRTMESYKQEVDVLKGHLASAQDDVATLLNEKKNLLDTIRILQDRLGNSDSSYQNFNSKR